MIGKVSEMRLFTTIVYTPDNIKIIIPNSKLFGDTIKNITAEETRRVDMVVGIGYGSSIEKAAEIMHGLLKDDPRVLAFYDGMCAQYADRQGLVGPARDAFVANCRASIPQVFPVGYDESSGGGE